MLAFPSLGAGARVRPLRWGRMAGIASGEFLGESYRWLPMRAAPLTLALSQEGRGDRNEDSLACGFVYLLLPN